MEVGRRVVWGEKGVGHTHTHTHIRHPHTWRDKTKGGSWEGEGERRERQTVTHRGQMAGVLAAGTAALPGITEIVFKARKTLNVRRAETLPRFTNSVIYLQDQMHSYYTAETHHTCTDNLRDTTLLSVLQESLRQNKITVLLY